MISIVNYGIGNVGSVLNMLAHVGVPGRLASTPEEVRGAGALILPGVGAFGGAMQRLRDAGFADAIREKVAAGTPLLGICLGMQLLGRSSTEAPGVEGFGFIDAAFTRFDPGAAGGPLKVPHMGWNTLSVTRPNPLVEAEAGEQRFYFVHSYYARCRNPEDVVATARYGTDFAAIYGRGNVWGAQFHPEKSHRFGMQLFRRFAAFAC